MIFSLLYFETIPKTEPNSGTIYIGPHVRAVSVLSDTRAGISSTVIVAVLGRISLVFENV